MAKDKKIQWHPAFYGAMHLELRKNKEELEFTEELSRKNHIWLNSLTANLEESYVTELITTTQKLEQNDDKNHADSLWEVITRINKETIEKVRKDGNMCT